MAVLRTTSQSMMNSGVVLLEVVEENENDSSESTRHKLILILPRLSPRCVPSRCGSFLRRNYVMVRSELICRLTTIFRHPACHNDFIAGPSKRSTGLSAPTLSNEVIYHITVSASILTVV